MKQLKAILAFCAVSMSLLAAQDIRTYTMQTSDGTITVDGALTEAVWKTKPLISEFASLKDTKTAIPQTSVWITQNETQLLVAVECMEPSMSALATKITSHDDEVWRDDALELFFDAAGKRDSFVQIIVNANGVIMDGIVAGEKRKLDTSWESGAIAKTKRLADRWTLEIAIPFANLPLGEPNCNWCFHVARERVAGERMYLTSLHSSITGFHQIECFDLLRGVKATNQQVHVVDVGYGECLPGMNTAFLTLRSLAKEPVQCTVATNWSDTPEKTVMLTLPPGAEERVNLKWNCNQTQGETVRFDLRLEVGGIVLRRFEKVVTSVPKPLGDFERLVFYQQSNAPTVVPFQVNLSADMLNEAVIVWELWSLNGTQVCSGQTAVRSRETCIRLFWTFQTEGRYKLKRMLVSRKTQQPLAPQREDIVCLVKHPWEE